MSTKQIERHKENADDVTYQKWIIGGLKIYAAGSSDRQPGSTDPQSLLNDNQVHQIEQLINLIREMHLTSVSLLYFECKL